MLLMLAFILKEMVYNVNFTSNLRRKFEIFDMKILNLLLICLYIDWI